MNNWKKIRAIIYFVLLMAFGVFIFIYGGYDDSPGAQLLGLIVFLISIIGIYRSVRKNFK